MVSPGAEVGLHSLQQINIWGTYLLFLSTHIRIKTAISGISIVIGGKAQILVIMHYEGKHPPDPNTCTPFTCRGFSLVPSFA
jgi:hypothetical protein